MTIIKLARFIELNGESKETLAARAGVSLRTVYNWLDDIDADYLVNYDARSNKVRRVDRHDSRRVDKVKAKKKVIE